VIEARDAVAFEALVREFEIASTRIGETIALPHLRFPGHDEDEDALDLSIRDLFDTWSRPLRGFYDELPAHVRSNGNAHA
jgi:hypothetical protein